jgi:hypothetical protein
MADFGVGDDVVSKFDPFHLTASHVANSNIQRQGSKNNSLKSQKLGRGLTV